MKFKIFIRVVVPIAILAGLFLLFFNITRVDVFESSETFKKKENRAILSISNIRTLFVINKAAITSEKMGGKLNVVRPHYILDVYHIDNKKETVYLWIDPKSTKAMYVKEDGSSTGYSLSEKSTKQLKEIIFKNK